MKRIGLVLTLLAMMAPAAVPGLAAGAPIDIEWGDLIPPAAAPNPFDEMIERLDRQADPFAGGSRGATPRGLVQHGEIIEVQGGAEVVDTYNGKTVRLSGYVIPLDYSGVGVTSFMLVPFVGACIHVPPPPPNQLVFVTTERPLEVEGLFEPYTVTGELGTATTTTELAEVGYMLKAERIEPYR